MTDQPSNLGQPEPPSSPSPESTPATPGPEETSAYQQPQVGAHPVPLPAPWPLESPAVTPTDSISTEDTLRLRTPPTSREILEALPTQPHVPVVPTQPRTLPTDTDRRFLLTPAVIVLIFALLGASLLIAGYNTAQANVQPTRAVQSFCRDLQSHHFAAAYALLSPSYRVNLSATQFADAGLLQDQVDGEIRACPIATGPSIDLSFGTPQNHTSYLITILRDKPQSGHIALIQQAGSWKVDALEQSLVGTDVDPLLVVQTFCEAIMKADYATAYSSLSSRQQSLATEQMFATQFSSALGGPVRLNSCAMKFATYTVRASAASIATTINLTISTATGGSVTTSLVTVLSLTQANGAWKIDDFSLQPASS